MSNIKHVAMITVCGRPNVGKSSLTNALVGEKVAIVSNKAQTTRNRIYGVVERGDTQFILMDTPGLHKPRQHRVLMPAVAAQFNSAKAPVALVRGLYQKRIFLKRYLYLRYLLPPSAIKRFRHGFLPQIGKLRPLPSQPPQ